MFPSFNEIKDHASRNLWPFIVGFLLGIAAIVFIYESFVLIHREGRVDSLETKLGNAVDELIAKDKEISIHKKGIEQRDAQINNIRSRSLNEVGDTDMLRILKERIISLESDAMLDRENINACKKELSSSRSQVDEKIQQNDLLKNSNQELENTIDKIRARPSCWSIQNNFPIEVTIKHGETWISDDGIIRVALRGFNFCEDYSKQAKMSGLKRIGETLAEVGDNYVIASGSTEYVVTITGVDCEDNKTATFTVFPTPNVDPLNDIAS